MRTGFSNRRTHRGMRPLCGNSRSGGTQRVRRRASLSDLYCRRSLSNFFGPRLCRRASLPPVHSPGIAVLRLPRVASLGVLTTLVPSLMTALQTNSIAGQLWVVEVGRIRVYETPSLLDA